MSSMEDRRQVRKIMPEELEALIDEVSFSNPIGTTLTVCHLHLKCGITLVGTSGCLNPDDFNPEIGENIAYDNAFKQLWQLEGYARLRVFVDGLNKADVVKTDYLTEKRKWLRRVVVEMNDLQVKMWALRDFLNNPELTANMQSDMLELMVKQREIMSQYWEILNKRVRLVSEDESRFPEDQE